MKLLARTNAYYLFFSLITYVIIAGGFYLVIVYVVYRDVEERLVVERRDFEQFIRTHRPAQGDISFVEGKILLQKLTDSVEIASPFKDTLLYDRYNDQMVPFREYSFVSTIASDRYKVSIRKSLIEPNRLLKIITATMLVWLTGGLILLFWFQRRISKTIWKPFYDTLTRTKSFDVTLGSNLQLEQTDIFEFNELNVELNKMTDKISRDYKNLKEFTENASHEIQTPLALINSRVEDIIQDKDFTSDQMSKIQDIHDATMRLSKLNQALLLLSKIENGQFYDRDEINVTEIVERKVTEFEEIMNLKGLQLNFEKRGDFFVSLNATLADILVTNLINNAVKHNLQKGYINIICSAESMEFSNPGEPLTIHPDALFQRFKKQKQASGSLGLGLAIVKKICTMHGLLVQYSCEGNIHRLTISRAKANVL